MKTNTHTVLLFVLSLAGITLTSCVGPGYSGGGASVSVGAYPSAGAGYGGARPGPRAQQGDAYFYGGRYYYGGRYESGSFRDQGRTYSNRYYHDGRYYYGGRHEQHTESHGRDGREGHGTSYGNNPNSGRPYARF